MHDLVVLSDLHLGRGLNPETGRFHRLETFFHDGDFERFCRYLCNEATRSGRPVRLLLNGDVFDFLRVDPVAPGPNATLTERMYGPSLTPALTSNLVRGILEGHRPLVAGLAALLAAGHEVVFLPGNHDIELQWEPVQAEVRRAVLAQVSSEAGAEAAAAVGARLSFKPWFHYEPGRIWVEHGCQYDPENAFRYLLRGDLVGRPEVLAEAEEDVPLGNFFQRYLYNGFGSITFIVPSARANFRYFKWFLLNEPRFLVRVIIRHLPFMVQLLRRLGHVAATSRGEVRKVHEAAVERLGQESGLGEKLKQVDQLKSKGAEVLSAVREIVRQLLKLASLGVAAVFLGGSLWSAISFAIAELQVGFGGKAILSMVANVLLWGLVLLGSAYFLLRMPRAAPPRTHRRAAEQLAQLLDVPLVVFGHTHDEEVWPLQRASGRGWYFNTGTWVSVFTHDVLLPRDRLQFTFLRVVGDKPELLHWSPSRGEPLRVILLEERAPGTSLAA